MIQQTGTYRWHKHMHIGTHTHIYIYIRDTLPLKHCSFSLIILPDCLRFLTTCLNSSLDFPANIVELPEGLCLYCVYIVFICLCMLWYVWIQLFSCFLYSLYDFPDFLHDFSTGSDFPRFQPFSSRGFSQPQVFHPSCAPLVALRALFQRLPGPPGPTGGGQHGGSRGKRLSRAEGGTHGPGIYHIISYIYI